MQIHSPRKKTTRFPVFLNQLLLIPHAFCTLGCGIMLFLQVITSAVLLVIAALRNRKKHERISSCPF